MGWRLALTLEQPLRSCQPTAHGRHQGRVEQQMHRDPHGCASRGDPITGLRARRVGAFPGIDRHVDVASGVGHLAEHRQVGGAQHTVGIRLREELEGRLPVASGGRLTGTLEEVHTSGLAHRSPPIPWTNSSGGSIGEP